MLEPWLHQGQPLHHLIHPLHLFIIQTQHQVQLEQIHHHVKQHHPLLVEILQEIVQVGPQMWTQAKKPQKLQYLKDTWSSFPEKHQIKVWEPLSYGSKYKVSCPKNHLNFVEILQRILSLYDQLVDFAVKCDIPLTWLERAKEDYPQDSQVVVNKVFYEWWDRCNLNVAKKLHMIKAAFASMGKPAVFNRILNKCPDLEMLLSYARSNMMPALTGGDGIIHTNKTYVLEDADALGLESVRKGQITTVQHDLIKTLSIVVRTECALHTYLWLLGCTAWIWASGYTKIQNLDVANGSDFDQVLFTSY